MIAIDNLCRRFDGVLALNDLSVNIMDDDRIAVIGPNGSGKTTLLNLISGVDRPSSGTVRVCNRPAFDRHDHIGFGLARTFQAPRLFESLNVHQNILAGLAATGSGKGLRDWVATLRADWHSNAHEISEMLRIIGLEAKRDTAIQELSYGQRKLVELARALVGNPRILLLDEPTAGLNRPEAQVVLALLHEVLARRRICLIVIEHDFRFVQSLCNRVLVLDQGNLIFDGTPAAAKDDTNVVESYLGAL